MDNHIAAASIFITRRLVEKMDKLRYFRLAEIEAALFDYLCVVYSVNITDSKIKGFNRFMEIYKAGLNQSKELNDDELPAIVLDAIKTLCTEIVLFG